MTDTDQPDAPRKRARVVALKRPALPVNADAVALCEELLRLAKAGELVELVAVCGLPDGSTDNERTAIASVSAILGELCLVSDGLSEAARSGD